MFRALSTIVLLMIGAAFAAHAQPTARQIVERSDQLMRGDSQTATQAMTIVRPGWERTIRMQTWAEGEERAFIRILDPARERGTSYLKIGRELWQYVPRINRVIKIPPSMMLQSWMGSDFTNDDLVRESSTVSDYTHTLVGRERLEGAPVYHVRLEPRPGVAVAWARLEMWIREADYIPVQAQFFNERGEKVRTLHYRDIRSIGGRSLPTRLELIEETRAGHRTIMVMEEATFNQRIPASVFTQENLRRAR